MTSEAQMILRKALALCTADRADLAAELLASLDAPADEDAATVNAAWVAELERRAAGVLSGEAATEDWGALRDRLAEQLKG